MKCSTSKAVLFFLNTVIYLLGLCLLAIPFIPVQQLCDIKPSDVRSLDFIPVLAGFGGFLMVFSFLGCAVAKRADGSSWLCFLSYLLLAIVLLLAEVGTGAMLMKGDFVIDRIRSYHPEAAGKVEDSQDFASSAAMSSFYEDFTDVFTAGGCRVVVAPDGGHEGWVCDECAPLEQVLEHCEETWPMDEAKAEKFYEDCSAEYEEAGDMGEASIFCRCTQTVKDKMLDAAQYAKISLGGLVFLQIALVTAACCVVRREKVRRSKYSKADKEDRPQKKKPEAGGAPNIAVNIDYKGRE